MAIAKLFALNANAIKQLIFLVSKKYWDIMTVEDPKSKKKDAVYAIKRTLFYYVSQEIWLGNSKKLMCIDQSKFYIFSYPREFKNV